MNERRVVVHALQRLGGPQVGSPLGGIRGTSTYNTNKKTCWNRAHTNSKASQPKPKHTLNSPFKNIVFHKADCCCYSSCQKVMVYSYWKNKLNLANVSVQTHFISHVQPLFNPMNTKKHIGSIWVIVNLPQKIELLLVACWFFILTSFWHKCKHSYVWEQSQSLILLVTEMMVQFFFQKTLGGHCSVKGRKYSVNPPHPQNVLGVQTLELEVLL